MKVHELIAKLATVDPNLRVSVWTSSGEYGTPDPTLVSKKGKVERVLIGVKEDD